MILTRGDSQDARWRSRRVAGYAVRVTASVVPFALSVLTIAALSRVMARPVGARAVAGWYAGICAASWLVLWRSHRLLHGCCLWPGCLRCRCCSRSGRRPGCAWPGRWPAGATWTTCSPGGATRKRRAPSRPLSGSSPWSAPSPEHDRSTRGHSERVRTLAT